MLVAADRSVNGESNVMLDGRTVRGVDVVGDRGTCGPGVCCAGFGGGGRVRQPCPTGVCSGLVIHPEAVAAQSRSRPAKMIAPEAGIEPATYCLGGSCSIP